MLHAILQPRGWSPSEGSEARARLRLRREEQCVRQADRWADSGEVRWAADFPVLGVTVHLECTDPGVGQVLAEGFAVWRDLPPAPRSSARATIRISVHDHPEARGDSVAFAYRLTDPDRLFVQTLGSVGGAGLRRGGGRAPGV